MSEAIYDQQFYDLQQDGSYRSAKHYLGYLFSMWVPGSVVDVGCGRGTWLAACREFGAKRTLGLDGSWNAREKMVDPHIEFQPCDLEKKIALDRTFDLVMSLEVAEHLESGSSDTFLDSLTALGGAVLFGAAFIAQPGANHINTRPHSFWAEKFLARGYALFDLFRGVFWSDERVEPWYRQNTFLYVKPGHPLYAALVGRGHSCQPDARFTDCVHPWLYLLALQEVASLRKRVAELRPGQ
jgi:SAM-dependent methyltransferase